ncbi:MAG TPA: UBP-type zinc finger domain-containing protein [Candidatus Binatia bacterium]|nr:UBP-type zinc finger domain-containing protein [Candidatus Binatia bacterium]
MATTCKHLAMLREVVPKSLGCNECIATGLKWKQLRLCTSCGYVGCCETSEGRHALAHFAETTHPIIRSFEDGEDWMWCYVDETYIGHPTGTRNW